MAETIDQHSNPSPPFSRIVDTANSYRDTRHQLRLHFSQASTRDISVGKEPSTEATTTDRAITGYHRDEVGDWAAELECGHNQHVRHQPPWQVREWILDQDSRNSRVGTALPCPLCDRAELPEGLKMVRHAEWDEVTLPVGLRRAHRLGTGTWGRIVLRSGRLHFCAATSPPIDAQLEAGSMQAIPPGVEHEVQPLGPVRLTLEFLAIERPNAGVDTDSRDDEPSESGDPACWSGLVCPECGGVAGDGRGHREGCTADQSRQ